MYGILFGILLGILEAVFGAWKDTLFEAFSWKTFFRSPIVVTIWSIVIGLWLFPTAPFFLVGASALGLERFSIEAWKAILRKPPGKFQRNGRDVGWLKERFERVWISIEN